MATVYDRGTFRGVPFLFTRGGADVGRRQSVFELPGRDVPFVEDMGRLARRWVLDVLVVGFRDQAGALTDYRATRDAFIDALETEGPGELVHPTFGALSVRVLESRGPVESTRDGGTARFSVTFVESGEALFPADPVDTGAAVAAAADAADTAAADQLADDMDTDIKPGLLANALAQAKAAVDKIKRTVAAVVDLATNNPITQALDDLNEIAGTVTEGVTAITDAASDLIRSPIDLYQRVQQIFGDIRTAVNNPFDAFRALKDFFDFDGDGSAIPATTPGRVAQAGNRAALITAFQVAATAAACRVSVDIEYDSQADADAVRDGLVAHIDRLIEQGEDGTGLSGAAPGPALFDALMDLRAAVVRDLSSRPGLPGIKTVVPPVTTPALVLAYRLYGDAGRADDIVSRNRIVHPGFVSGGTALEVLDA